MTAIRRWLVVLAWMFSPHARRERRLRALGFEPVSDEQRARHRLVNIGAALMLASLPGCASAWQTGAALVASAHVAVSGYQSYTHDARRSILAASGCHDGSACEAALAPFEARQAPVLACLSALAPLVDAAAIAADAKDARAAAVVVPDLAAKVPICVAEIEKAKR